MKTFFKIFVFGIILSGVIILGFILILLFTDCYMQQEEILSETNERIYLKRIERGLSYEVNFISDIKGNIEHNTSNSIVGCDGSIFFYKIKNDTLFIKGGLWENIDSHKLKITIKYEGIYNETFNDYLINYKKYGFKKFPEKGNYKRSIIKLR